MLKTKKRLFVIVVVVLFLSLVLYLASSGRLPLYRDEDSTPPVNEVDFAFSREMSVVRTHEVPGGEDVVRFTVYIDDGGLIVGTRARGEFDPSSDTKLEEFSENLLLVIKGKKLADLEEVDRVGTSSLTTEAFNDSLGELKAQI